MMKPHKTMLLHLFEAGVAACKPEVCLPPYLPTLKNADKICVIGAGKAAAHMAAVVSAAYPEQCYGTIVTRHGHAVGAETGAIKVFEASHPVPDHSSMVAAKLILAEAQHVPTDVPTLALISGGGSALMCLPAPGLALPDKMAVHRFLLNSGASIKEMNIVRKHLSAIKGGRLGAAVRSEYFASFIVSDVVGDDPALVASGPTVADASAPADALEILRSYGWDPIDAVEGLLQQASATAPESPRQDRHIHMVASGKRMLTAAEAAAKMAGWRVCIIGAEVTGEASQVAKCHAAEALAAKRRGERCILLSGGELTVSHDGTGGKGGPNQEYLLALAIALDGAPGIAALACDSDGIDGSEDNAGAYICDNTLGRASGLSLSPDSYLMTHDSYRFFAALDDLLVTGPTHTNVNDFRAIVIDV
ncbi:MAG: DUF4147 domain-containing protein [Kordiimonadaceae bacterium]|nr:DUF4147 domain-containing protein [Kordiimonadaceae bacterium]